MKKPPQNVPKPTYGQLKKENIQLKKTLAISHEAEKRLNIKYCGNQSWIARLFSDVKYPANHR